MISEFLYVLLALVAMFLLLPLRVGLGIRRTGPGDSTGYHLSTGFFVGLGGLRIQAQADRHHLYPELFGRPITFLGWRIPVKSGPPPVAKPGKEPPKSIQEKKKQDDRPTSQKLKRIAFLLLKPGSSYLLQLPRIVGGLHLCADGQIGVPDPSQTGRIYGYVNCLQALLGRRVRLQIEPNFTGPGVSGILDLRFRLHFGLLLFLTLLFAGRVGLRWLAWQLSGGWRKTESLLPRRWRRWHHM